MAEAGVGLLISVLHENDHHFCVACSHFRSELNNWSSLSLECLTFDIPSVLVHVAAGRVFSEMCLDFGGRRVAHLRALSNPVQLRLFAAPSGFEIGDTLSLPKFSMVS